ncbi:MAG: hypothetical protein ACI4FX_05645 [Agathobacter sp.]
MNMEEMMSCSGTNEQNPATGVCFIKSRRAESNVMKIAEEMATSARENGILVNHVYQDTGNSYDYDRQELNGFFEYLMNHDTQTVVVRNLYEITDDLEDLKEFITTINDWGIKVYCIAFGPVPVAVSQSDTYGC